MRSNMCMHYTHAGAHTHVVVLTHASRAHTCIRTCASTLICVQMHENNSKKRTPCPLHPISNQVLFTVDSRLHVSFLPRKRDWTGGNALTGSPGVLTRVRAARGREWLWEAVPPLSSLSTDYEAGPRRVPLGTPQATHSLPLLCYRICRWGIRLKCEEGCMWETCREF